MQAPTVWFFWDLRRSLSFSIPGASSLPTDSFPFLTHRMRHLLLVRLSDPTDSRGVTSKSDTQEILLSNCLTQAVLFLEPLLAVCLSCLQQASHHTAHGCHHTPVCVPAREITCSWSGSCCKLGTQPATRGASMVLGTCNCVPSETDPSAGFFSRESWGCSAWRRGDLRAAFQYLKGLQESWRGTFDKGL